MTVAYLNQILSFSAAADTCNHLVTFCIGRYVQENIDLRKQFMFRALIWGFLIHLNSKKNIFNILMIEEIFYIKINKLRLSKKNNKDFIISR